jgi:hypothetical protein
MKVVSVFIIIVPLLFSQCRPIRNSVGHKGYVEAAIVKEGFIDCFEKDLKNNGQPVWCEASAILYDGKKLLIANDKDMPDTRASVFYWALQNNMLDTVAQPVYNTNAVTKRASKYEDFAQIPGNKSFFLTTAFDRIKPASHDWDNYNTLLYFENGIESNPAIVHTNSSDSGSVSLRYQIAKALISTAFPQGVPYFKVEGLAATKNKLYWGIREEGKQFDSFTYKIKILAVPYTVDRGGVVLGQNFTVLADMNIDSLKPGPETIAISSIEYDPYNKRFLILTSYELREKLGGYLWTATEEQLQQNKMYLVKDANGNPIHFRNKCEDVTVINKKRIIVIHDDDRQMLSVNGVIRKPHQAAYSIVDFK